MLVQHVTTKVIDQALADIDDSKALGLDGFNSVFFKKKKTWQVIKHDVQTGVLEFFANEFMHKSVNCNAVTMIPLDG